MKKGRRDALTPARLHRSADFTACCVPGPGEEVIRNLAPAREGTKRDLSVPRGDDDALQEGQIVSTVDWRSQWTNLDIASMDAVDVSPSLKADCIALTHDCKTAM